MKSLHPKAYPLQCAELLKQFGISDIFISPGSRSAPLTLVFGKDEYFNRYVIPDERAASFMALGHGLAKGKPAVLICTSGTALLNYSSAVTEAKMQHVPLIVLSADRPDGAHEMNDGQAIWQKDVFDRNVGLSVNLICDATTEAEQKNNIEQTQKALEFCINQPTSIHLNIPFDEPLYIEATNEITIPPIVEKLAIKVAIPKLDFTEHEKVMVIIGQQNVAHPIEVPQHLSQTAVVFTETISNLSGDNLFQCIDRTIDGLTEDESNQFRPDLIITCGDAIVSKKVKRWLRQFENLTHWHISSNGNYYDTFGKQVVEIEGKWETVLTQNKIENTNSEFLDFWNEKKIETGIRHSEFLVECPWSDLVAFAEIYKTLPQHCNIHWANSSPVRYAQLFEDYPAGVLHFGNRATSGIEGSTSTAVGFALAKPNEKNLLITGDLAFVYDSHAFWHQHIPSNLKVIVINNGGGGIFRIIPGPLKSGLADPYFESPNAANLSSICEAYGVKHSCIDNARDLNQRLVSFFASDGTEVLEIATPREENDRVLKDYFKYLKQGNV